MSQQQPGFDGPPPAGQHPHAPVPESQLPQARPIAPPPGAGGGSPPPTYIVLPPQKGGRGWLLFLLCLLIGSVVTNVILMTVVGATLSGGAGWKGRVRTQTLNNGKKDKVIAVLPVYGIIDDNMAAWLDEGLKALADDKNVRAVVLHVDTPGGTVVASDRIHHAMLDFRKRSRKPIVIAQGGFATSGGYYVSSAGDYIVSEPTTWTANIGVIMTTFVAERGLKDKLGVNPIVITSSNTPFKDVPSLFRELKPEERAYLQGLVDSAYDRFVSVVAAGRKLDLDEAKKLANGQVLTADQAMKARLVDAEGYLEDAWRKAASLAGVSEDDARVIEYSPRPASLRDVLLGQAPVPAVGGKSPDLIQTIGSLSAPRLMYLYHGPVPAASWPSMDYSSGQQ
ncbi:MAG: hypothetical protein BIFFINMI_02644 [Phycisphaerae bacterium]|nr:hypothetical protein [Phycisphaerae bacterium]